MTANRRMGGAALALAVVIGCLALGAGSVGATPEQIDVTPTCPQDYPPGTAEGTTEITVTQAQFTPGGSGSLALAGTIPNHNYVGTIFSTPIDIGPSVSDGAGNVSFSFAVPSDFELGTSHNVTLTCEDVLSATFQICLDANGNLTDAAACSAGQIVTTSTTAGRNGPPTTTSGQQGGNLARTGIDYALILLRVALVLIALGALVLYARRYREHRQQLGA